MQDNLLNAVNVPGFSFDYTDPNTGANYPNAWFVITNVLYGTPDFVSGDTATSALIQYDIYVNQQSVGVKQPFAPNQRLSCVKRDGSNNFETYFQQPVLKMPDHDIDTQAYLCLFVYLNSR